MVARSTLSGKLWNVPKRQLKPHRLRHRPGMANICWSELEHIWRQSMPREPRWWPVSRWLQEIGISEGLSVEPAPETSSEVQKLQALVAQLQSQFLQATGPTPMTLDIPSSKITCLRVSRRCSNGCGTINKTSR